MIEPYDDPVSVEVPIERFQGFLIFTDASGQYHWVGGIDDYATIEEVRRDIATYMAAAMGE